MATSYRPSIERSWHIDSTDGVRLAAYDLGGEGPPLLMCHATGFCGLCYAPLAEALADSFHCYTFDFRAHGGSTAPDGEMVWTGMGDDVLAVAADISPNRPLLAVGHSMGGAALVFAETARPGTLRRAWTFEPILFPYVDGTRDPSPISEGARRRRPGFDSRDDAYERFAGRPPLNRLDPRVLRCYVDYGLVDAQDGDNAPVVLACSPEHEAAVYEYHSSGASDRVGELRIPFVAAASGDGQRPAEAVIETAAKHPNLDLARYPDLDHFGPLAAPDRLAPDIIDVLRGPAAGGGADVGDGDVGEGGWT